MFFLYIFFKDSVEILPYKFYGNRNASHSSIHSSFNFSCFKERSGCLHTFISHLHRRHHSNLLCNVLHKALLARTSNLEILFPIAYTNVTPVSPSSIYLVHPTVSESRWTEFHLTDSFRGTDYARKERDEHASQYNSEALPCETGNKAQGCPRRQCTAGASKFPTHL
jgi:hypothetical protein